MGDHSVGLSTAAAISAALFARERTGEGQMVSTSLLRQGVYTIGFDLNMVLGWGLTTAVGTREAMGNPAINNYAAGDGRRFWIVGLEGERHWPPLARAVGHPEWLVDERFSTPGARAQNARELIAELDRIFAPKPLDEWAVVVETEIDFFWSPLNTDDDVLADPHLAHAGGLVVVPDGSSGTTMIASPADFHGTPWAPRSLAPKLGEHTREVLAQLGRSDAAIDELLTAGVATQAIDQD
jgi:crotonobetainyl-CoA:carnitine CoA-transferase CaiB-like acyl-CoA transferase